MTEKTLAIEMINTFPDLEDEYIKLIKSYEGEFPGNHIIMGDVFTTWLINVLSNSDDKDILEKAFKFLNKMADSDQSVANVLQVTILERLGDYPELLSIAKKHLNQKAIKLSDYNEKAWGRLCNIDYKISELEKIAENREYNAEHINEGSLPRWYDGIRQTNLSQLTDKDLGIMLRQHLYLEYIIPFILYMIKCNYVAGYMWEGQMMTNMAENTDKNFWDKNSNLVYHLKKVIGDIYTSNFINTHFWDLEEEKQEFIEALTKLENMVK